jgi:hypothetical protein
MASISWMDSTGSGTLDRVRSWTPRDESIGPAEWAPSTGRIQGAKYRRDGLIDFDLPHIPGSSLPMMLRLKLFLVKGGTIALAADNVLDERWSYATLAPGTRPTVEFSDRVRLTYTFSCTLREADAPWVGSPMMSLPRLLGATLTIT